MVERLISRGDTKYEIKRLYRQERSGIKRSSIDYEDENSLVSLLEDVLKGECNVGKENLGKVIVGREERVAKKQREVVD